MSKRKLRYLIGGVLLVAVVGAAIFTWTRSGGQKWPEFPQSRQGEPVAVAELLPDFAWRTGDVIPLTVYIKDTAAAPCDLKSITIRGDAQLRSVNTVVSEQPDGSRFIRATLEVQCFVLKPVWKVTPTITYRAGEKQDRLDLELPEFEIGSSNTYDHRKIERVTKSGKKIELKDGHPKEQPVEYLQTTPWLQDVVVATLGLMMTVVALWVIGTRPRHERKRGSRPLVVHSNEWNETLQDVRAAMKQLMDGQTDTAIYVRVQNGLQRLFRLESVALPEIEAAADAGCNQLLSLRHILEYCHRVIYAQAELERSDIEKMNELLPEALEAAPRFTGLPAVTRTQPGEEFATVSEEAGY